MERTRRELARIDASDDGFTARWETAPADVPVAADGDESRRRTGWWVAALVALILVGIGAAAWSVFAPADTSESNDRTASQRKDQPNEGTAGPSTGSTSSPPTTSATTPDTTAPSGNRSLAAAENFVSTYYTLVPDDTEAGWAQLSPDFQQATSRESYDEFWDSYSSVSVTNVRAVSPTVVDYTISYDGSSPEAKQITLIPNGSSYLIDSDGQQG